MTKPKIFIYDWKAKKEIWRDINELFEIVKVSEVPPHELNGLDGAILHKPNLNQNLSHREGSSSCFNFIEMAKEKNFPIIIHTDDPIITEYIDTKIRSYDLSYNNLYQVKTYNELIEKAKEVFV